jgi:CheY-like chemotaxis protein
VALRPSSGRELIFRVDVLIPMAPEHEHGAVAVDSPGAPTILVVEDEWIIRAAIADYLRQCGYRVLEAGDADEAVTALNVHSRIAVVFTDVQMPGSMDGWALARWVRREHPGVKVIITSGVVRVSEAAGDLCEDGPLMLKPYRHAELERRIRMLLADR